MSPPSGQSGADRNFDSFDEDADPFEEGWDLGRTVADGQDYQEQPPQPPTKDEEASRGASGGGSASPPKDPFLTQKAKTIKTAEALSRAISDLNELREFPQHYTMIKAVRKMIETIKPLK